MNEELMIACALRMWNFCDACQRLWNFYFEQMEYEQVKSTLDVPVGD